MKNFICKVLDDGSLYGIFQYFGWYKLETRTRVMLCEQYANEEEVDALIEFGDICKLNERVPSCFDTDSAFGCCRSAKNTGYDDGRDLSAKKYDKLENSELSTCNHIYIFDKDKKWRMYRPQANSPKKERIRVSYFDSAKYYSAPIVKKSMQPQEVKFEDLL